MGIYSHWLENEASIEGLRSLYKIPADVHVRAADPNRISLRDYSGGWMPFPLVAINEGGVRFPLHPRLRRCLSQWSLCPCQLLPNVFKIIMGTAKLNEVLGIDLSVFDIEDVYDICKLGDAYYL